MIKIRMYLSIPLLIVPVMLLLLAGTAFAEAKAEIQEMAERLLQKGNELKKEKATLDQELTGLETAVNRLKQRDKDIKRENAALKRESSGLQMQKGRLNRDTASYNSYCQGKYYEEEYRKRKRWCDANFRPLNTRKKQLIQALKDRNRRGRALVQKRNKLSQDTLKWTKQRKEHDRKFYAWQRRHLEWMGRVKNLMSWPALEDLKRREKVSWQCANIKNAIIAQSCLKKVWDGAR